MSEHADDQVELARQVKPHQKRTASGKVVQVAGYVRTDNSAAADRARASAGRPQVAASAGRFPGGRSAPIWPDAGKRPAGSSSDPEQVEYEGIEETGEVDQEALDTEVPVAVEILSNMPPNPALNKLIGVLKTLSTASLSTTADTSLNEVELAKRGIVRVSGYSYVSKKTGKIVRVNPYTQIRRLISSLGGIQLAAKRGLTPDLFDAALPGYQVKDKAFKVKEATDGGAARRVQGILSSRQKRFDIPKPSRDGKDTVRAMSPTHPLETVRSSPEGSRVIRGNETWERGLDGLWYKTPRRNNKGLDDRSLTKKLVSREGTVELQETSPVPRKLFEDSKPDYSRLDPNSTNYIAATRFTKALEPTYRNLPEGVADSLNGHIDVRRDSRQGTTSYAKMTSVSSTRANNFYPTLRVHTNPEYEKDLMSALPKQQREGYSVPSLLHPTETMMARATSPYVEELFKRRAPAEMYERMYDRLSAAYDRAVKNDDGDYSGLRGRTGWDARMTNSSRSQELRQELRDGLSFSALSSPEDFLAESWTEYVGNPEPRPLARGLGEAFQSSMEEFSDYLFKNKWFDASEIPERVYERTTAKDVSRRVSDAIGGAEDRTVETNLSPPNLRSVLANSSKYVDIRDDNGNPLFDAHIVREGNNVYIDTLSLPTTDPESMPDGIPTGVEIVNMADNARYYSTPIEDLRRGPSNQRFFADTIDMERSLKAIEAVEETSFYEGVRRFEAHANAGQDSVLYAHAGYQFRPDTTDVHEISSMLNDLQDVLSYTAEDSSEGHWVIPRNIRNSMTRKINEWQNNLSDHPDTWPTPKEIADLGRYDVTTKSLGEAVLSNYSWDGVKDLPDSAYTPWSDSALNLPDPDARDNSPRVPRGDTVSASAVGSVARALREDSSGPEAFEGMLREVVGRHSDIVPGATSEVFGDARNHTLRARNGDGDELFSIQVLKGDDGSLSIGDFSIKSDDPAAAILAFDTFDSFESAYMQSGSSRLVRRAREDDTLGNYILSASGYDWVEPPQREELESLALEAINAQVERHRSVLENTLGNRAPYLNTEDMYRMQDEIDRTVEGLRQSLHQQTNSVLAKFDNDPKGPTPFELAQLGKREAILVEGIRTGNTGDPSLDYQTLGRTDRLGGNPFLDPRDVRPLDMRQDRINEGGVLDAMTDLDGDPSKNSTMEFLGKQLLTGGLYDQFKTLQGFWSWATDSYKPTARKAAVGLLFLLIRLMPASVFRGALLSTVGTLTRRIRSPRPDDWPSVAEINEVIDDIQKHLPDTEVP